MSDPIDSVIDQLLNKEEVLDINLPSYKYIEILDLLMYSALQPVVETCGIVEDWLTELLPLIEFDGRRKISIVPRQSMIEYIFSALMTDNRQLRFEYIKLMMLERSIILDLLKRVSNIAGDYDHLQHRYCETGSDQKRFKYQLRINRIEQALKVYGPQQTLQPALRSSAFWLDLTYEFKGMLSQKYYKMAWKEARKAAKLTHMTVDVRDLFKNYTLAIDKAISKFSPHKGTLTSYIQRWFQNANINPEHPHQYGLSFDIPNSFRRDLQRHGWVKNGKVIQNVSSPISELTDEELSPVDPTELEGTSNQRYLAALPETKYALLTSGVPYTLSDAEMQALRDTNKPSIGPQQSL